MEKHEATSIIIFGASGDLTERKLIPALYNLHLKDRLPDHYDIIGISRSKYSHDEFRAKLQEKARGFAEEAYSDDTWAAFAEHIWYVPGDASKAEYYPTLLEFLAEKETGRTNRLYYLSTAPFLYEPILEQLGNCGLNNAENETRDGDASGWRRVVIEKPFGYDLKTAHALNDKVHEVFHEEQVYRIDHYLGKETAQNILFLRFGNTIFEPIWNRNYIDHIQITVAESVDVGRRAGYYDTSGVLRDMFQNHLLQLLALTAMEPPISFDADLLRNEKVKVLQAVQPIDMSETVRAQYTGYSELEGVEEGSETATYAALKLNIDNWRWQGVPFYLRSGKAMHRKVSEIQVEFKKPPKMMFSGPNLEDASPNRLCITIQPDEGIRLSFQAKLPDSSQEMRSVRMAFAYSSDFGEFTIPDAYERLLLDALRGDAALFTRSDGIEAQWTIIDHVLEGWQGAAAPPLSYYEPGSWGPNAADQMLAKEGRTWDNE